MQVSQNTTALVALGSLASLASTITPTIQTVPVPIKAKASKPAKQVSPRRKVTLAIDAMLAAFDEWAWEQVTACGETLDAWSMGEIEDDELDFQALENWRVEVSNKGKLAFRIFMEQEPETVNAYAKASDEWAAYKKANKAGGVR